MTVEKIRLGNNEDGTPHYLYRSTDPNAHLVVTGPISGAVTVNGSQVDVTDAVIEVVDEVTALAVSDAIGERHAAEGHPLFTEEAHDFVHIPSTTPEV